MSASDYTIPSHGILLFFDTQWRVYISLAGDGTYSGQNIFWEASSAPLSTPNWAKAVQDWYDEVDDRDGSLNTVAYK